MHISPAMGGWEPWCTLFTSWSLRAGLRFGGVVMMVLCWSWFGANLDGGRGDASVESKRRRRVKAPWCTIARACRVHSGDMGYHLWMVPHVFPTAGRRFGRSSAKCLLGRCRTIKPLASHLGCEAKPEDGSYKARREAWLPSLDLTNKRENKASIGT